MSVDEALLTLSAQHAAKRPGCGQLTVLREGRVVLDSRWGGGAEDLHWVFSVSKLLVTTLVFQQVDAGVLQLDAPVCRYWPEFMARGKGRVTLRHVLTHRSGLPTAHPKLLGGAFRDVQLMTDWGGFVAALERAPLAARPGGRPAYGYLTFGFILGEVLRRAVGLPLGELARAAVFEPLGMADSFLGLPRSHAHRAVPLLGEGSVARRTARLVNREEVRAAVIPAGGLSTTSRDLAVLLEALRLPGLLSAASLRVMVAPTDCGQRDGFVHLGVRYGHGVQLGGPRQDFLGFGPLGKTSTLTTFGFNGSNVALGWVDPASATVFAYAGGYQSNYLRDFTFLAELSDLVLGASRSAG